MSLVPNSPPSQKTKAQKGTKPRRYSTTLQNTKVVRKIKSGHYRTETERAGGFDNNGAAVLPSIPRRSTTTQQSRRTSLATRAKTSTDLPRYCENFKRNDNERCARNYRRKASKVGPSGPTRSSSMDVMSEAPQDYDDGEIYGAGDTLSEMNILERRSYVPKDRRSSIAALITDKYNVARSQQHHFSDGSLSFPDKKNTNLPSLFNNHTNCDIDALLEKLQMFALHAEDSGQDDEDDQMLQRPPPRNNSLKKSMSIDKNSSMFSVTNNAMQRRRGSHAQEFRGIVKHVIGDLSKKMQNTQPQKSDDDYLPVYFNKLKPISTVNGCSRLRSLSMDLEVIQPPLRRTKSSNGALVVYGIKPELFNVHCPHRRGARVDIKAKLFQRAVIAIKAQNKMAAARSVWK